jgi:hypothetical protein
VCIRYRGNVYTELLPSKGKEIFTEPLPSNDRGDTHTLRHTYGTIIQRPQSWFSSPRKPQISTEMLIILHAYMFRAILTRTTYMAEVLPIFRGELPLPAPAVCHPDIFSLRSYFEGIQYAYEITLLSVCVCVCLRIPLIVTRQRFGGSVTAVTNTHATIRRIVGRLVFNVVRVISRKVGD